jgi:competence protein ComEC
MKIPKKAHFATLLTIAFFMFFLYKKWPDTSMKITFCDVGQGDSILIHQGFFQVLIDSGRDDRVLSCLGKFLPVWDRTIEVMILTHADEDHIGYFGEIMGIFETNFIFFPDTPKDTRTARGVKEVINQELAQGAVLKEPILGQSISFPSGGKLTFLKLPGNLAWEETENDRSLVFLLEYQGTSWLFTGDLEEKGERLMQQNGLFPRVNVLKVSHHGSQTSSSNQFLQTIQPDIAVISVGDNSYGHPDPLVLQNLQQINAQILRTDQLGHIELAAQAGQIWLQSTSK